MVYEMELQIKGNEPSLKQVFHQNIDICKAIYSVNTPQDYNLLRYSPTQRLQKAISQRAFAIL